jgi:hypothetical protein
MRSDSENETSPMVHPRDQRIPLKIFTELTEDQV